jgi:hypothetical protein
MRISEITDAQGQLELLRTVIDNTWTAIAQQAEQEKRVEAERKAQAEIKRRSKKSIKGTSIRIPPPPPTKKPQAPLAKQPYSPINKPNPNALNAVKPVPPTNPQLKQQPINTALNPKLTSKLSRNSVATNQIKQHNGVKDGYFGKNIGTLEKDDNGDDRYSKNSIATLKK